MATFLIELDFEVTADDLVEAQRLAANIIHVDHDAKFEWPQIDMDSITIAVKELP